MICTLRAIAFLALTAIATPAFAAECAATVEATDAMQFTTRSLIVPAGCKQFSVTLKHTGKLPATAMGHNFVLGRDADIAGIAADGMKAGAAANFVKPGDRRVIASSAVVGGGQSATVVIPVDRLKTGEAYTYICSFPGHFVIMRGTLVLMHRAPER